MYENYYQPNYYQPTYPTDARNNFNLQQQTPINPMNNNVYSNPIPTVQEMQKAYEVYQWINNSGLTGEEIDALAKIKKEKTKDINEFLELNLKDKKSDNASDNNNSSKEINEIKESLKVTNDKLNKLEELLDSLTSSSNSKENTEETKRSNRKLELNK